MCPSCAHFVPISCPGRARGFQRSVEMTVGRRARGLTIGSTSRPLVVRSKGRGGPDRWVDPQVVPSYRRLVAFRSHAVPKPCDATVSDPCAPVPVPKRAQSRIKDPATQLLRGIHRPASIRERELEAPHPCKDSTTKRESRSSTPRAELDRRQRGSMSWASSAIPSAPSGSSQVLRVRFTR